MWTGTAELCEVEAFLLGDAFGQGACENTLAVGLGSGRRAKPKAEAEAEAAEKGVVSAVAPAHLGASVAPRKVSCRLGSSTQLSGECSGVTV